MKRICLVKLPKEVDQSKEFEWKLGKVDLDKRLFYPRVGWMVMR